MRRELSDFYRQQDKNEYNNIKIGSAIPMLVGVTIYLLVIHSIF